MTHTVNKDLLFGYFDGRTTPLQRQLIKEWLQTPAHQEQYYAWLQEWEATHPQLVTDPDAAYHRFRAQLAETSSNNPVRLTRRTWFHPWLVAATFAGVLLSVGAYLTYGWWGMQTLATTYGEIRSLQLPDGSRVTLNANSEIQLLRFGFGRSSRLVTLRGEAEFSVVHQANHQRFVVQTPEGVEVVVLGTEFVVAARRGQTHVTLNRGKVQLRYPTGAQQQTLTMHPGDWVDVAGRGALHRGRVRPTDRSAAWKEFRYDFRRTTLREIGNLLEDQFGLTVAVSPQLAGRNVTGTFHARNADELLQALTELFDVQVHRQDDTVTLTPADSIDTP